jgi:hypothetical protein
MRMETHIEYLFFDADPPERTSPVVTGPVWLSPVLLTVTGEATRTQFVVTGRTTKRIGVPLLNGKGTATFSDSFNVRENLSQPDRFRLEYTATLTYDNGRFSLKLTNFNSVCR